MKVGDLKKLLVRRPFLPLRLVSKAGESVMVFDPSNVKVGAEMVIVNDSETLFMSRPEDVRVEELEWETLYRRKR